MDSSSFFQFRQIRSFDEVLSEAFRFVRVHARPLGTIVLAIGGTYLLIPMVLFAIAIFSNNILLIAITQFLSLLAPLLVNTVVCHYIAFYREDPHYTPSVQEVWKASKPFLGRIVLGNMLYSFAIIIGLLFLLIPGIYVGVAMSFIPVILIHERYTVMESIDHSIATVKGYWWQTFGILATTMLVIVLLSIFLSLPQVIITWLHSSMLTSLGETPTLFLFVLSNGLLKLGSLIGYTLFITVVTFQYYNLVERKEAPGLMERVQNMTEQEPLPDKNNSQSVG